MKRLVVLAIVTLGCGEDPRGMCVHQYVDHYTTYTTFTTVNKVTVPTVHHDPVYECDVWAKVSNDSVLVTTKVGRDRPVVHVGAEGYR